MSKKDFFKYPLYWDEAPIDLSFIYENEKPAGKHGFLKVKKDKFIFEDGEIGKFWGVNFNSGANFPRFEQSEKIAKRLAKYGINIVRFHQLDAQWANPNIFQFAKGKRKGNTDKFDAKSMKRLDYLVYCLKKEGIYIYIDMLTYRKFKSGDEIKKPNELSDAAKPYAMFDERLIYLQKKFCEKFWNHYNPYTKSLYKNEPAIALVEIVNECDLFTKSKPIEIEPYKTNLIEKYKKWSKEKGKEIKDDEIDFSEKSNEILSFLIYVQKKYFLEMKKFMENIGVKIPITGTNWGTNVANRISHKEMLFNDGHTYWYNWGQWTENKKQFNNKPLFGDRSTMIPALAFCRTFDKPFFVSEWDDPWPNEWRSATPLYLAAIGSLQGWSGFAIHAYRYSTIEGVNITGKEVSSKSIGGVAYREGVFNTFNDPAKFGLFYHAALMFRRGDIKEADKKIGIKAYDYFLCPGEISTEKKNNDIAVFEEELAEKHKIGMVFDEKSELGDENIEYDERYFSENTKDVISDTKELYRSWEDKYGFIDTARTKVIYGLLGEKNKIKLNGLEVKVENDFATIALSSLDDKPLEKSKNILLTTIGRSENTDMIFNEKHDVLIDVGKPPILIESIKATFKLKTKVKDMRVFSINPEGFHAGEIETEYNKNNISFKTGEKYLSMYYLIQQE